MNGFVTPPAPSYPKRGFVIKGRTPRSQYHIFTKKKRVETTREPTRAHRTGKEQLARSADKTSGQEYEHDYDDRENPAITPLRSCWRHGYLPFGLGLTAVRRIRSCFFLHFLAIERSYRGPGEGIGSQRSAFPQPGGSATPRSSISSSDEIVRAPLG